MEAMDLGHSVGSDSGPSEGSGVCKERVLHAGNGSHCP